MLTKSFSAEEYQDALEAWEWIGWRGKTAVLASLFGDVFLRDGSGFWFLDTTEGSLSHVWNSQDEVQATLDTADGQDRYLLGGLAMAADRQGLKLGAKEVYDVTPPPILGGKLVVEQLVKMDFVVSLHLRGQIHEQVRNLRPGTRITGLTVDHGNAKGPAGASDGRASHRRWRRGRRP